MSWIFGAAKMLMNKKNVQETVVHLSKGLNAAKQYAKDFNCAHFAQVWKEANDGDIESQFQVAESYFKGKGVDPDPAEAALWYGRAASGGHARAQCILAMLCYLGKGVEKDFPTAWKWMRLSLNQDDLEANQAWRTIAEKIPESDRLRGDQLAQDFSLVIFKSDNHNGSK